MVSTIDASCYDFIVIITSSSLKQLGCCGTALDLELEDVTLAVQSLSRSPHHLAFLSLSVSKMGATIVPPVQADVRIK